LPESLDDAAELVTDLEKGPEPSRRENNSAWLAHAIYNRVSEKLTREPVEDFRIDFEDGYGNRPDDEEDGHAASAAAEVAKGSKEGTLPPFIGIRIKPFNEELRTRSLRTLDIFVSTLIEQNEGRLPDNFVVTLPKITIPQQAATLASLLERLEQANGLAAGDQFAVAAPRGGRPLYRRTLRHLRLHRRLQHHRGASTHDASGV
jgi:hypothetical protein